MQTGPAPDGQNTTGGGLGDNECRMLRGAIELAGKKWNAAIMLAIGSGADRYSNIRHAVAGISDRLLTARLRDLETHGLVERHVIPTVPVQVRYTLTAAGAELIRVLRPLGDWSRRWAITDPGDSSGISRSLGGAR